MGSVDGRPVRRKRLTELSTRIFDVCAALLLLFLLTPLIVLISIGIVLDSRGPIFYRCTRIGRDGRSFRMLKFRKMEAHAEGPPLTLASDVRFTRFGRLLAIEARLGRVRGAGPRFGPRAIDLDLLLYDGETIDEPGLTVPHPRLAERRFALEPLAELDPELEIPGRGSVQALLAGLQ